MFPVGRYCQGEGGELIPDALLALWSSTNLETFTDNLCIARHSILAFARGRQKLLFVDLCKRVGRSLRYV